jgi:hypothetical protein
MEMVQTNVIFRKTKTDGTRVEVEVIRYDASYSAVVWIDGKSFANARPTAPSDYDRKYRKLPADAACLIWKAIFLGDEGRAILEGFAAKEAELKASDLAEAATAEPIGYLFEIGCDSGDTHRMLWPQEVSYRSQSLRESDFAAAEIVKHLSFRDFDSIAEATMAEAVPSSGSTYRGWKFTRAGLDQMAALAKDRQHALEAKRSANKAAANATEQAALKQARETGTPVELERYTAECCDPNESCNLDIVIRYAMPDGSTKTESSHTW